MVANITNVYNRGIGPWGRHRPSSRIPQLVASPGTKPDGGKGLGADRGRAYVVDSGRPASLSLFVNCQLPLLVLPHSRERSDSCRPEGANRARPRVHWNSPQKLPGASPTAGRRAGRRRAGTAARAGSLRRRCNPPACTSNLRLPSPHRAHKPVEPRTPWPGRMFQQARGSSAVTAQMQRLVSRFGTGGSFSVIMDARGAWWGKKSSSPRCHRSSIAGPSSCSAATPARP